MFRSRRHTFDFRYAHKKRITSQVIRINSAKVLTGCMVVFFKLFKSIQKEGILLDINKSKLPNQWEEGKGSRIVLWF